MEKRGSVTTILIIVLIIGILAGGFLYLQYFYEKPTVQIASEAFHNVSIRVVDGDSGNQIITQVTILNMGTNQIIKTLNTTINDYSFITVPTNVSLLAYTTNLPGQTYYLTTASFITASDAPTRLDIKVYSHGTMNLTQGDSFLLSNPVQVTSNKTGWTHPEELCLQWSNNFIRVWPDGLSQMDIPTRLKNKVTSCYQIIDNNQNLQTFPIKFIENDNLGLDDYIQVFILDGDMKYNSGGNYFVADDKGNPLGMPDINLTLH